MGRGDKEQGEINPRAATAQQEPPIPHNTSPRQAQHEAGGMRAHPSIPPGSGTGKTPLSLCTALIPAEGNEGRACDGQTFGHPEEPGPHFLCPNLTSPLQIPPFPIDGTGRCFPRHSPLDSRRPVGAGAAPGPVPPCHGQPGGAAGAPEVSMGLVAPLGVPVVLLQGAAAQEGSEVREEHRVVQVVPKLEEGREGEAT